MCNKNDPWRFSQFVAFLQLMNQPTFGEQQNAPKICLFYSKKKNGIRCWLLKRFKSKYYLNKGGDHLVFTEQLSWCFRGEKTLCWVSLRADGARKTSVLDSQLPLKSVSWQLHQKLLFMCLQNQAGISPYKNNSGNIKSGCTVFSKLAKNGSPCANG